MKCRGLFLANDIVYIPVTDESVTDMMKDVKSFASYNNMKIKTELGFFIRQDPLTVEKAVRCEVLERPEEQKQVKLTSEEKAQRAVEIGK
jgi:predicted RNA-binding protein